MRVSSSLLTFLPAVLKIKAIEIYGDIMRGLIDWMVKRKTALFLLLGIFFVLALAGRLIVTKSVIGGDAVNYYSTVHAFVMSHKLDLKAELEHYYNERSGFTGNRKLSGPPHPSSTGLVPINYPIGLALMLVPFFFLGHLVTLALSPFIPGLSPDGYGPVYQLLTGLGSMLYAFLGLFAIYRFGRKRYAETSVLLAVMLTCLGTPLVYYMTMEPLLSHTMSVFSISVFLAVWYSNRNDMKLQHWVILGLLGGLAGITRYQDGLIIVIPPVYALVSFIKTRQWKNLQIPGGLVYVLIFAAVYSLQLIVNKIDYGSFFTTSYASNKEGFIYWANPKILFSLFSPYCGLLTRSPVVLFSFIGLYYLFKKDMTAAILLAGFFLAQLYLVSSWWIPYQGDTFGNRMLLNCVFIFAVGMMEFFDRIHENRKVFNLCLSLALLMVIINLALVPLYCFRLIGNSYAR